MSYQQRVYYQPGQQTPYQQTPQISTYEGSSYYQQTPYQQTPQSSYYQQTPYQQTPYQQTPYQQTPQSSYYQQTPQSSYYQQTPYQQTPLTSYSSISEPLNFDGYEIITYEQYPTTDQWALVPLYKINQRGNRMYWQIGYNPYENKLISLSRQMEDAKGNLGKLRVSKLDVKMNKSGRSFQEQAVLEAKSKYHKKYQENYRPEGESESIFLPAQLANDYRPPINYQTGEGSQITLRHLQRGIACQAKIDGIRARSWILVNEIPEKNQVILLSRKNNEFTSPYHIKDELKYFFSFLYQEIIDKGYNPYGENLKTQWGIDGELYNHDLSFEEITSRVKTKNTIHPQVTDLQYYIFDLIVPNVPYDIRKEILERSYRKHYEYMQSRSNLVLLTTVIARSYQEIDSYLMNFLSYKYEGLMMRKMLGNNPNINQFVNQFMNLTDKEIEETYYKPERNDNLLKYKLTVSEEGIVLDIVPGEGKESDLAELIIQDSRGNIFKIHPSGSYETRREWLENRQKYIGLPYTFKYQELTESGIPRFAVGIAFRTYE